MLEKSNQFENRLVGIVTQNQSEEKLNEYLDELEFLTCTTVCESNQPLFHKKKWRP
jgi:hypothetical protein